MKHIIKLDKEDIKTGKLFENIQIDCADGNTIVVLSRDAAEELQKDLEVLLSVEVIEVSHGDADEIGENHDD